jgi:formamidopyrimidine-DNA glycosylase
MPELPEVETIVRALRQGGREGPPVVGRTFASAEVLWPRSLALPDLAEFLQRIPGQTVVDVYRRGKFICLQLDRDTMIVHLRMSGDLRVEMSRDGNDQLLPLKDHDRATFTYVDGLRLVFNDARKFGRIWLTAVPNDVTGSLGPEPLAPGFGSQDLYALLQAKQRMLKPLLMDQTFLAGLGNIYTDEALHLARLHPTRRASSLTFDQAERLWSSIRQVLEEGIRRNGASIDWVYRGGNFQNTFRVYQRTGNPCPVCGTPIVRRVIGQRSTHFCPFCQPEE